MHLLSSADVQEVPGDDVSEGLRGGKVFLVERARLLPVQVEGAEAPVIVAEGQREHGTEPGGDGPRSEVHEAFLSFKVSDGDRPLRFVGRDAGPFTNLGLQTLKPQCVLVGGCDVVRLLVHGIKVTPALVIGKTSTMRSTR